MTGSPGLQGMKGLVGATGLQVGFVVLYILWYLVVHNCFLLFKFYNKKTYFVLTTINFV